MVCSYSSFFLWSATIETCLGSQTIEGDYESPLFGCMDETACNYNANADTDDGSCTYAVDCDGNCLSGDLLFMYDSYGDGWNGAVLTINGSDYSLESGVIGLLI